MRAAHTPNALPLSRTQWWALVAAAGRELGWGLRAVAREVAHWRTRAEAIPDPDLRHDALQALDGKRGHIDGAAMFWTLPRRRNLLLLRTLVAYEILLDYLDGVSERAAQLGPGTSRCLYGAAVDALDPSRARSDPFRLHPSRGDGGYLADLVTTCRRGCVSLAAYDAVRPLLVREAERTTVLGLNHEPNAARRTAVLRAWAQTELPPMPGLSWYEQTAAASGWLMTHVLIALAAEPSTTRVLAERVHAAYLPWVGLAVTLLDSYVDQLDDRCDDAHSYIAYYPSAAVACARVQESIRRAVLETRPLPDAERHAVLLACMVALYLGKDSARAPTLRATTAEIAAAGGSLTRLLMPILRAWRVCNGQRRAT